MKKSILFAGLVFLAMSCKKEEPTPVPTPEPDVQVNDLPTEFQYIKQIFNGEGVGAAVNLTEDIVLIFNQAGDKYVWVEDDEIQATYSLTDATGHLEDCPLNSIGSAAVVSGAQPRVYFFDTAGMNYCSATFSVADADEGWNYNSLFTFGSSVLPLTGWGPDNCPFTNIRAMWRYSNPGTTCYGASEADQIAWMVNETGDEIIKYTNTNGGSFDAPIELENWTATNNCNGPDGLIPLETLGAVYRIVRPNKIQEVMFNLTGDQFCFYNVSEGVFSQVYDVNY